MTIHLSLEQLVHIAIHTPNMNLETMRTILRFVVQYSHTLDQQLEICDQFFLPENEQLKIIPISETDTICTLEELFKEERSAFKKRLNCITTKTVKEKIKMAENVCIVFTTYIKQENQCNKS